MSRELLFSHYDDQPRQWVVGSSLSHVATTFPWKAGVYLDHELILCDIAVARVPLKNLLKAETRLKGYARLITVAGIVCVPLKETAYGSSEVNEIYPKLAEFIDGQPIAPFTVIAPAEIYAVSHEGSEIHKL